MNMDTADEVLEYTQQKLTNAQTRLKDVAASDDQVMIAYLEGMILAYEHVIDAIEYTRA